MIGDTLSMVSGDVKATCWFLSIGYRNPVYTRRSPDVRCCWDREKARGVRRYAESTIAQKAGTPDAKHWSAGPLGAGGGLADYVAW
jgi:hypothetical protein